MVITEKLLKNNFRKLRFINRFSGQFLVKSETNSDHVWEMISMALELIPEWNKELPEDQKLDLKEIIYRISIHDLDECLTSDIPRPFKYYSESFTNAIKDVVDEIMMNEFSNELYNDIKSAKDHSVREGLVVSILDMVQVSTKYIDEAYNCGNNSVKEGYMPYNINSLNKLLSELRSKSNDKFYELMSEFVNNVLIDLDDIENY